MRKLPGICQESSWHMASVLIHECRFSLSLSLHQQFWQDGQGDAAICAAAHEIEFNTDTVHTLRHLHKIARRGVTVFMHMMPGPLPPCIESQQGLAHAPGIWQGAQSASVFREHGHPDDE